MVLASRPSVLKLSLIFPVYLWIFHHCKQLKRYIEARGASLMEGTPLYAWTGPAISESCLGKRWHEVCKAYAAWLDGQSVERDSWWSLLFSCPFEIAEMLSANDASLQKITPQNRSFLSLAEINPLPIGKNRSALSKKQMREIPVNKPHHLSSGFANTFHLQSFQTPWTDFTN